MKLDTHPVTGELREYLSMPLKRPLKRVNLRTPKAIERRMKYKANKPKKSRVRCQFCRKQFTPKLSTKRFCSPVCCNQSNIREHKQFKEHGIYLQWGKLPLDIRKSIPQIKLLRELLYKVA